MSALQFLLLEIVDDHVSTGPVPSPSDATAVASVVPGLSTSAPRRGLYWTTGTHPRIASRRSSACGPAGPRRCTRRPLRLIQKRRTDRAHNAPVLAVHVDDRPTPGVSIDTPLLPCGSGGWGRKNISEAHGPSFATLRQVTERANCPAR
jgi:hypothetical protein